MSPSAVTVCARSFAAQAAKKAAPAAVPQESLKATILQNGTVVVSAEANLPVARVAVSLRVGSRDETYDNRGAAHTLRSLTGTACKGATAIGITRTLNQAGASLHCTGGRESTLYVLESLQSNVNGVLPILGEVSVRPAFKPWEVQDNLPRLKLELASATPEAKVMDLLHQAAFRSGLGNGVLCPSEMVGKLNDNHLQKFVAENYSGGRAAVVGLGVKHNQLVDFAQSLNLPSGASKPAAPKFSAGELRVNQKGPLAYVALAGSGASLADPKTAITYAILQRVLGAGASTKRGVGSGLLVKSVGESGPASVSALNVNYSDAGLFGLFAVAEAGAIHKVVGGALKTLKSTKVSQADLARGKALFRLDVLDAEDSGARLIEELAQQALIRGQSVHTAQDFISVADTVTVDDLNKALSQVANGKMAMAAIGNLKSTPYLDEW